MADYTLDWDGALTDIDGDNTLTGVDGNVVVTVSTPDNLGGESFFVQDNGGGVGNVLGAYYPDRPTDDDTTVSMSFDQAVENVTFSLYDIDTGTGSGTGGWDDKVEIIATLSNGTQVTITFDSAGNQLVNGNTIEGAGINTDRSDEVLVTIDGPVDYIEIVYSNGDSHDSVGYVGIGDISFDVYHVPCFARGTYIETNRGEVAIEDLLAGDLVRTLDNGMQPIRWIGSMTVSAKDKMAPICIKKGAMGNTRDLRVSPAHRIMLQGWQTELLFGNDQMLAAAKSLVNDATITVQKSDTVEYFHILFDRHEIIFSEGLATESFHPAEASVGTMAADARAEIYDLFPQLQNSAASYGPSVRESLRAHEVALINS